MFLVTVSEEHVLKDLAMTIRNKKLGNFKKWGLNPLLPQRKPKETHEAAAKRFFRETGWSNNVSGYFPEILSWWEQVGTKYTTVLSKRLNIKIPSKISVYLIPFGPGGSFCPKSNSIWMRLNPGDSKEWWQHVILHELTHILCFADFSEAHADREKKVNDFMKKTLSDMFLIGLI